MGFLWKYDNGYALAERLIEIIIAIYFFKIFLSAFRCITRDRNNILDKMDKFIFMTAFSQIIVLLLYFLLFRCVFLLATLRTLRLAQESFVCMVFTYFLYEEDKHEDIFKKIKLFFIVVLVLWFFSAILQKADYDYTCVSIFWILFSGLTLIVSALSIYFGLSTLRIIQNHEINEKMESLQQQIAHDEMDNRKRQLFVLMNMGFITSAVQFLWDNISHNCAGDKPENCKYYYEAWNFFTLVLFLIIKSLTYFLANLSIYYVFYCRNKKYFNTAQESNERSLSVFYDFRSELLDDLEGDTTTNKN